MRENWVVAAKRADFYAIAQKFHIDPVIARLIRNRDVTGDAAIEKYLNGTLADLCDPALLKDLPEAVMFLIKAIDDGRKIRIIGDYDIDGVMASYILLQGLSRLGADVDVRIPERIRDGYGLNARLVEQAHADGKQILITCDNGIAAADELELAYELGMQAVVTDHHEVPKSIDDDGAEHVILPRAEAVIDPKRPDCPYPFKGLCGAAVAWKLITALYRQAGIPMEEVWDFLEYAAFATIGDVMDLTDENRIIVREGLKRLRATKNPGMAELIRQNKIEPDSLDVYHVGFILGPCMNASGRLDTAGHALELLTAGEGPEAARLAGDLIALNASRKSMTVQNEEAAMRLIEKTGLDQDRVMVVYLPDCHESLAGIVAGRIREQYNRPVFVLTQAADGVKGSGRSIDAYDMYAGLCGCSELLTKFGGHRLAAGLSLDEEQIDAFRRQINRQCTLSEEDLIPKTVIDVPMPVSYATVQLADQISLLKPFGKGNSKPVFADRKLMVSQPRIFGINRNVVKCCLVTQDGYSIDAVYFGDGEQFVNETAGGALIDVIYYPGIDTFRGRNSLQLTITNYRRSRSD